MSAAHDKANTELRGRFDTTLASIQTSLASHTADRERQFADNEALRGQVNKLLQYDTAKDAAHTHALHTKDLEQRLVATQLAQAQAVVDMREQQLQLLRAETEQRLAKEKELQVEVAGYAQRQAGVQEVMERSSQVMEDMKKEVEKLRKRLKKESDERVKAEEKVKESTSMLLTALEDRKQDQLELLKAKRQTTVLQSLCQTLEREKRERKERDREMRTGVLGAESQVKVKAAEVKTQTSLAPDEASTERDR